MESLLYIPLLVMISPHLFLHDVKETVQGHDEAFEDPLYQKLSNLTQILPSYQILKVIINFQETLISRKFEKTKENAEYDLANLFWRTLRRLKYTVSLIGPIN